MTLQHYDSVAPQLFDNMTLQLCDTTALQNHGSAMLQLYDTNIHVLINVKKILAVINATYAVAKRKPEKPFFSQLHKLR